jgi:hypothetical protein
MPEALPKDAIDEAASAVAYAQQVRAFHRRRTGRSSNQRETDITLALTRIREAMAPLRVQIGRFPYGPQTDLAEHNRDVIREASAALQAERRKLWKMSTKTTKRSEA